MKKALLGLCAVLALSASAANEYTCVPSQGAINIGDYPGGIGSIEINVDNAVINRNCETGFATLSRDGQVLKAIPASNVRMVYTYEEFDRTDVGTPHISFYDKVNSPANKPGNYTVTIPSNFFTVNGVGNAPLVYNFSISGLLVDYTYTPENNSSIEELSTLKITFEGATDLSWSPKPNSQDGTSTGIYYEIPNPDNEDETLAVDCTDVYIDGNVAEISFPTYKVVGNVSVNINAGVFSFKDSKGVSGSNGAVLLRYSISPKMGDSEFVITPAPGTVEDLVAIKKVEGDYAPINYFFNLSAPEGYKFGLIAARKVYLQVEDANGKLSNTKYDFNKWTVSEDKTVADLASSQNSGIEQLNLAPGTYYLVIPANQFYIYAPGEQISAPYGKELKFGPWIVEGEPDTYTISPSEPVESLSEITITFDEGKTCEVNPIAWFTIMNGAIQYDMRGKADGNVVTISINPPLTVTGEYTLEAPGSNISVDGKEAPVSATFTVVRSFINHLSLVSDNATAKVSQVDDPDYGGKIWEAEVLIKEENASLTFELPMDYESVWVLNNEIGNDPMLAPRRVPTSELEDAGFKKLVDNTLTGLNEGVYQLMFTYADANGNALEPAALSLEVKIDTSSVAEIEAAENAEYYTLQGVKVVNPENGIYIKVANGKASKVNIK